MLTRERFRFLHEVHCRLMFISFFSPQMVVAFTLGRFVCAAVGPVSLVRNVR